MSRIGSFGIGMLIVGSVIALATAVAVAQDPTVVDAKHYKVMFENEQVRILKITGGNVTKAARLAGRNRTEFYRLLERHSLEPGMFKGSHKEKATA